MFNRCYRCNPYRKWLGIALLALGAILLIVFVPAKFWLALLGAALMVIGILLLRF